jgi:multidrug efflux pump subunit AcrA (membrane-fusion protein)
VSEADLQAERGGRVTSVRVKAGDVVAAGTVIATLENAAEQASVLQAQGAYQAALASRAQGTVGVREAETALTTAKNTSRTAVAAALNTVSGIVRTDIDAYFSGADTALPGLRISGYGETTSIVNSRVALTTTLQTWEQSVSALSDSSDLSAALLDARTRTGAVVSLVDSLINALNRDTSATGAALDERNAKISALTAVRGSLLTLQSSLQASANSLSAAKDALARAEINASGANGPSATDAQITQALGTLRAAQANLEKTIMRSPISGQVAVLRVSVGEYLAPSTPVARVTGGRGLEISVFVGERDRDRFSVGAPVVIDGYATGTVINIAPAIDPLTQKVEVKVATDDARLVNGDTVSLKLDTATTTVETMKRIEVPITAIKFTDTAGSIFVVENDKLVARPVSVGDINGSLVTITEGLDTTTEFVIDVRGKAEGETVTVIRD